MDVLTALMCKLPWQAATAIANVFLLIQGLRIVKTLLQVNFMTTSSCEQYFKTWSLDSSWHLWSFFALLLPGVNVMYANKEVLRLL